MITRRYWMALRWALAVWLLASFLGCVLIGIYFFQESEINDELARAEHQLGAMRQRALQQAKYQQDVAFYQSHRTHWQQHRPASVQQWTATWSALQQQWGLPHMQYDIQSSISCDGQSCARFWPANIVSGLSMTVTPVRLRWSVAHASEVIDWLQQLQREYAGMLLVRACTWSLADTADAIAAECELHWFDFPNLVPGQPA